MAFSKIKLQPGSDLLTLLAPAAFRNVRSSSEHTSIRKRQCYKCMNQIEKGEVYINHQFRYDKKIVTFSFHKECFNGQK